MHCSDAAKIQRVCQFHHKRIFSFALEIYPPELAGDKCTVVTQPKSRASASSATPAYSILLLIFTCRELAGNKCTVVTQPKSGVSANFTTPAYKHFAIVESHNKYIILQKLIFVNEKIAVRIAERKNICYNINKTRKSNRRAI